MLLCRVRLKQYKRLADLAQVGKGPAGRHGRMRGLNLTAGRSFLRAVAFLFGEISHKGIRGQAFTARFFEHGAGLRVIHRPSEDDHVYVAAVRVKNGRAQIRMFGGDRSDGILRFRLSSVGVDDYPPNCSLFRAGRHHT
jgi:hypothetical protein